MSAAPDAVRVCASDALSDGGAGVRVDATLRGEQAVVFFVRYDGRAYGYLNRCAHVPTEMDWNPGQFLDADRAFILCSIHGAAYDPRNGRCAGGPCGRGALVPLSIREEGGRVAWYPSADLEPVSFT